jgi:hypothetical protein
MLGSMMQSLARAESRAGEAAEMAATAAILGEAGFAAGLVGLAKARLSSGASPQPARLSTASMLAAPTVKARLKCPRLNAIVLSQKKPPIREGYYFLAQ